MHIEASLFPAIPRSVEFSPAKAQWVCPTTIAYATALDDRGPQWVQEALHSRMPKVSNADVSLALQGARARIFARAAIRSAETVLWMFEEAFPEETGLREAIATANLAISDSPDVASVYASINAAANAARAARAVRSPCRAVFAAADSGRAAAHAVFAAHSGKLAVAASDSAYAAYAANVAGDSGQWTLHVNALDEALSLTEIPQC